ncbi:Benzoylformate decarboxylase [Salix suchowensis]|nr:Benzoylformate decarboxylase [Salix suchowensis]
MYTASSVFLQTLADVGITHAFVNWGSDHPGILEDLERQRVENGRTALTIVTCPNEMVALSAAQGYAQVCGKPAAVIVHVDVGTQAAIVRQYMRNTTQLHSGKDMPSVIRRSLQIATSEPKGPVYLWARREVMEAHINPDEIRPALNAKVRLSNARNTPLILCFCSRIHHILCPPFSRNPSDNNVVPWPQQERRDSPHGTLPPARYPSRSLLSLSRQHPSSFPNASVVTYLWKGTHHPGLETADVILVINSDTPWIPENTAPNADAKIFVIDGGDVLKKTFGYNHSTNAEMVCNADAEVALKQIIDGVKDVDEKAHAAGLARILGGELIQQRAASLAADHSRRVRELDIEEDTWPAASADGSPTLRPQTSSASSAKQSRKQRRAEERMCSSSTKDQPLQCRLDHMRSDAPGGTSPLAVVAGLVSRRGDWGHARGGSPPRSGA